MIEAKFVWTISEEANHEPIYLHLSCDDYAYELMENNEPGKFTVTRVIPNT
jgi:hypothetical protein